MDLVLIGAILNGIGLVVGSIFLFFYLLDYLKEKVLGVFT